MTETFQYDVFLSHSSKDRQAARALAERLKADGLKVTWDKEKLEQARTLVLCMSPAYFDSEWGTLEHHTLLFRDPTNARRRFIPLLIADCTPPDVIAQFATIDWRMPTDEGYASLLAACRPEIPSTSTPGCSVDQVKILKGHSESVYAVAISPNGTWVASGGDDDTLRVWDLELGECISVLCQNDTAYHRGALRDSYG